MRPMPVEAIQPVGIPERRERLTLATNRRPFTNGERVATDYSRV